MVGGGGEAVRREACGGVEQDGERGKPDVANGRAVGGGNRLRSQLDAEGYWRETGRRGVGWMCWSRRRRGVREGGVLRCLAGRRRC